MEASEPEPVQQTMKAPESDQKAFIYCAYGDCPTSGERSGIYIKQERHMTFEGVRVSVGEINDLTTSQKPWKVVPHKPDTPEAIGEAKNDLHNPDTLWPGILTPELSNCMCIIVAIFDGGSKWSHAWLTHVTTEYSTEVHQMVGKLTEDNHWKAHVAIGGKTGSLDKMLRIKDAFLGTKVEDLRLKDPKTLGRGKPVPVVRKPLGPYPDPVYRPETVMIYAGGRDDEPLGFGLNKDGYVGEVTGSLH